MVTMQSATARSGRRAGRAVVPLLAMLAMGALPSAIAVAVENTPVDAQTKSELQGVVTRQLQAFEKDDATAAEAFAAPAIRDRFPEASKFLDMVKGNYGALIHPRSTQFGGVSDSPHGPLLRMTVVAADGSVWTAIYSFEKVESQWRITGCGLGKDGSQQSI